MLAFFRKYQRAFFIVFTVVIVISFSFFGTYSTLTERSYDDPIVFTATDGTQVHRSEVEELVQFIGTDQVDKIAFGGIWGPNFFNDGVLTNDFLKTGLAQLIIQKYAKDLSPEWETRFKREQGYVPYVHPQANFLSATNAWNYIAPDINTQLSLLKKAPSAISQEGVDARIHLFLTEKQVPAGTLRHILRLQQQQYSWIPPDPNLERADLSLFGYHTVEDWFGSSFVRLAAQFIIDAAKVAEQHGYKVTDEEVLADLERNADASFQQIKDSPYVNVTSPNDYYYQQLKLMRLDQTKAVKLWKQVLLFRRLFHDFGNASLVDSETYRQFYNYTTAYIDGDVYRLPLEFRLANFHALQQFELYINSIAKKSAEGKSLALPKSFLTAAEVAQKAPELVEKSYVIELGEVDKQSLQAKTSVKETWTWQIQEANWQKLQKQFPAVGVLTAKTQDERFKALETLDPTTRSQIDTFTRAALVDAHPEWINEALKKVELKKMTVGVRKKGGELPILGYDGKRGELIKALDSKDSYDKLTGDDQHFYVIKVLERGESDRIITFGEAVQDGTLDRLLTDKLDPAYIQMREANPESFKKADGEWKPFSDVRDSVAEKYYSKTLAAIKESVLSSLTEQEKKELKSESLTPDFLASRRLLSYVKEAQEALKKNNGSSLLKDMITPQTKAPLDNQWKLEKSDYHLARNGRVDPSLNKESLLKLSINAWSPVETPPNGDLMFVQVKKKGVSDDKGFITRQMLEGQKLLSEDAQRILARKYLDTWNLSIDYLKKNRVD